ncbi:UDP-2,4-diacetamido-2,4,6-trideoxy-beta-L-altropyranose hydrolase [Alienimonas californiensis]|uniref:UDP-2,4-diacetamido-2,4, 6-trideoxy-beta-L-altropyranose hydrolase n=1 Tax=Alienimonas californiensis TaxID=2527989 RepID=UPI001A997501|nr:UDP-2,4-diacetamido-2,4,6-trideoxy-beta-L-altropyranose hydrolase [Alienimonas californiensis]
MDAPPAGAPATDTPAAQDRPPGAGPGRLTLRADATARSGTGHVMRCLALAEAWRAAGGTATFAAAEIGDGLAAMVRSRGFDVTAVPAASGGDADADAVAALVQRSGGWLALDGYHFSADYKRCVGAAVPLLLVDDFAEPGYEAARLVFNQTLHADPAAYPDAAPGALLLGPKYTVLRREFLPYLDRAPVDGTLVERERVRRLLVTLGGSDPDDAAGAVLDALAELMGELDLPAVALVIGAMSPHADRVRAQAAALSARPGGPAVTVKTAVADMAAEIAAADLAVTAGGLTLQELAFLGVPAAIVRTADNQARGVAAAERAGFAVDLGRFPGLTVGEIAAGLRELLEDAPRRRAMSNAGRRTVDGRGAERVVRAALRGERPPLTLRPAGPDDAALLLAWRNDPAVREASRSPREVQPEEHARWLAGVLADPDRTLLIAEEGGAPVGSVRLDAGPSGQEISYTVAPAARGRGVAKWMSRAAAARVSGPLWAAVKPGNVASAKVAEAAGMQPASVEDGFRIFRRPALPQDGAVPRSAAEPSRPPAFPDDPD